MAKQDAVIKEIIELKNEVEAMIYKKAVDVESRLQQLEALNSVDSLKAFKGAL